MRHYLDYNATSPLSPRVLDWLKKGDFPMGNPSSLHSSGRRARRDVEKVRDFLFQVFGLDKQFRLFFHSGASEGVNTIIKGFSQALALRGERPHFFAFETDHSCVHASLSSLGSRGEVTWIPVDSSGNFQEEEVKKRIQKARGRPLLNYTWVHNETGVVHTLERAKKIKEETGCFVHIDAAQAVGKIPHWPHLLKPLDAYSFSTHKFGGLKGTGFSFVLEDFPFSPLIEGGGQEGGLRSGTENTPGILSTALALQDSVERYNFDQQNEGKLFIEEKLIELMGERGEIIGYKHPRRNGNTISFLLFHMEAQILSIAFDREGVEVSRGSACQSGAALPARVLMAMGYPRDQAKGAIRLSFSPFFTIDEARALWPSFEQVLRKFVNRISSPLV